MSSDLRAGVRLAILSVIPVDRYARRADMDAATDEVMAVIAEHLGDVDRPPAAPAPAEEHMARLAAGAWHLEHPPSCADRPCAVERLVASLPAPADGGGRWAATIVAGALKLTPATA